MAKFGQNIPQIMVKQGGVRYHEQGGRLCVIFTEKGVGDNVGVGTEVAFYGTYNHFLALTEAKCMGNLQMSIVREL